jgi:hypothetical protein
VDIEGLRAAQRLALVEFGDAGLADRVVWAYLNPDEAHAELDETARQTGYALGLEQVTRRRQQHPQT